MRTFAGKNGPIWEPCRVQDGLWPNHKKQTKLLNFGKALVEFPENLSKEGITFLFFDVFSCVLVINHF